MKVNFSRIICATDFSDRSMKAVPYALTLARDFSAKLYFCHAVDLSTAVMYGESLLDPQQIQARIKAYADELLGNAVGNDKVDWEAVVALGKPAESLRRLAEEKEADLVISATHGRAGFERFILGSVTERLMHTLDCPLLIVRGVITKTAENIGFKRILVGCDFSQDSMLALQYGLSLAQDFQSELHLAHVIEPDLFKELVESGLDIDPAVQPGFHERLQEDLQSLVPEEASNWCQPVLTILAGKPSEELIKYAVIHKIDLIVLGVHGHGFVEKLLVGSTTDRVIRMGPCPTLSVRPLQQDRK